MQISEEDLQRITKQVGKRIQQIRKAAGLTQVELEHKTEVYDVGAIERGETNPTLLTFLRLATALGVELKELFDIQEELIEEQKIRLELIILLSKQDVNIQRKGLELLKIFLSK